MSQMENGKAFEYAILREFKEKLDNSTNVKVVLNDILLISGIVVQTNHEYLHIRASYSY